MDWSTTGITLAIYAIQIALYVWQEPKIRAFESKRRISIEGVVDELLKADDAFESPKNRIVAYLLEVFEKDRDLIMPIAALTPYKKTTRWLGVALVISIATGFFHRVLSASTTGFVIAGEEITFSHAIGVSLLVIWLYVGQKLYWEFDYMTRLSARLGKEPSHQVGPI